MRLRGMGGLRSRKEYLDGVLILDFSGDFSVWRDLVDVNIFFLDLPWIFAMGVSIFSRVCVFLWLVRFGFSADR